MRDEDKRVSSEPGLLKISLLSFPPPFSPPLLSLHPFPWGRGGEGGQSHLLRMSLGWGGQDTQHQVLAFAAISVCDLGPVTSLLRASVPHLNNGRWHTDVCGAAPVSHHDVIRAEKLPRDGPVSPGRWSL